METAMATYTLDEIAEKARTHVMTPAERRAQRISMIMGLRSKKSVLTRENVQSMLDDFEGQPARSVAAK